MIKVIKFVLLIIFIAAPSFSASSKEAFTFVEYLSKKDFHNFLRREMKQVKRYEKDGGKLDIKLESLEEAEENITDLPKEKVDFYFRSKHKLFQTVIWDVFEGNPEKAVQMYAKITIGKGNTNLFISSGAGKKERINYLKSIHGGYAFVTDRMYKSSQAYNTKNKIHLYLYKLSKDTYVCVNKHVKDYGRELSDRGYKKDGKPYGPILYDVTIDFYHRIDKGSFQYVSFNVYEGQADKSRFKSVNAAKSIGNILTLGALNKGVGKVVKNQAKKVWDKRKVLFQALISN